MFMGGSNFLNTAAFLSSEYLFISMHFPPPVYPIINSDDATLFLTPGDPLTRGIEVIAVHQGNRGHGKAFSQTCGWWR
jgi:hypothetical protein